MSTTLIVVSDNHMRSETIQEIRKCHIEAQIFIHCGDSEMPYKALTGYACVRGNCDYDYEIPSSLIIPVENHKIYVTHGHRELFFRTYDELINKAKENDCDIVCFGHIHRYVDEIKEGIHLLNPGSLRNNRDGSKPSYMRLIIDEDEVVAHHLEYPKDLPR